MGVGPEEKGMTPAAPRILAAVVNHNTSAFCELMVRSFFNAHPDLPNLSLRVYDNASDDDTAPLRAYAAEKGVPFLPSGFTLASMNNSHGDVLRTFVLENPDCDYYLFLDADTVFAQPGTIPRMLAELSAAPEAFAAVPRMSWDGETPYAGIEEIPEVYGERLHPFCALVKNTPLFRAVVTEVGLFCVKFLWGDREEYLDTFKLMTRVMRTHGLRHLIASPLVIHFFSVSYEWDDPTVRQAKLAHRDTLLGRYRASQ
jgi:GT2 family glycosyltransferase